MIIFQKLAGMSQLKNLGNAWSNAQSKQVQDS